jgi:hypothetical protein
MTNSLAYEYACEGKRWRSSLETGVSARQPSTTAQHGSPTRPKWLGQGAVDGAIRIIMQLRLKPEKGHVGTIWRAIPPRQQRPAETRRRRPLVGSEVNPASRFGRQKQEGELRFSCRHILSVPFQLPHLCSLEVPFLQPRFRHRASWLLHV